MIDAATAKPPTFDVIVVHSFSRFFRDQFQLEFYVRRLAKNGVRLVSITQELGDDPMSNMIRQIMALFDEYQSKENAKHTLRAMKENARQGFWNGALPPIGYRIVAGEQRGVKVKKTLEIDPFQAETVRLIFRLALEGDGTSGPMGSQIDHQPSQRRRHPHPRRRTLGRRCRPQGADPDDLYRPSPLQHQVLEDPRAQAGDRGCRDGGPSHHRDRRVRGCTGPPQGPAARPGPLPASSAGRPSLPASASARPAGWR